MSVQTAAFPVAPIRRRPRATNYGRVFALTFIACAATARNNYGRVLL
jgi:hypothetical protein